MRMLSPNRHSATIPQSFFQHGNPSSQISNSASALNLWSAFVHTPQAMQVGSLRRE